jgi:DNA-binding CsgD family transcriptional regulator
MNPLHRLTERELEIVHWVAEGFYDREVAARLGYSTATIKANLGCAMRKLGVRNRVEAAVIYHIWNAR